MPACKIRLPLVTILLLLAQWSASTEEVLGRPSRRALLVACSKFPNAPKVTPLPGAENDVARFAQLLAGPKYKFEEIETLAGWSENSDHNPTAANIAAAFEQLIESAQRDDQIFILMSGHGIQVDTIQPDASYFGIAEEPDGKDEAFIAADYNFDNQIIRDNSIGQWLSRLKSKGAHVWIVFDCCHSGSLTRSVGDEVPRRLLTDTTLSTDDRPDNKKDPSDTGIVDLAPIIGDEDSTGSVVALFAAQNFETTPEMTRPIGSPASPESKRGLLSYHLEYLLNNLSGKATYRDIENSLANRYYSERGMRGPNPYFEGDRDRTVFGFERIQHTQVLTLEQKGNTWELRGGIMDGITFGTHLSVIADNEVVGTVVANEVGLNRSIVSWLDTPPRTSERSWRCDIAKQPIVPWKVSLRWVEVSDAASPVADSLKEWIRDEKDREESLIASPSPGTQSAECWNLCIATPESARDFGIEVNETSLLLMNDAAFARGESNTLPTGNEIHVAYPALSLVDLKRWLRGDITRLFRMQRLFQLTGLYGDGGPMLSTRGVSINFAPIANPGQLGKSSELKSGDQLAVRLASTKPKTLWYTVLLIQSNGLIAPIDSGAIARGMRRYPTELEIERIRLRPTSGNAAYVAITVPVLDERLPVDFSYLAQLPIGVHRSSEKSATRRNKAAANTSSSTKLGRLFSLTTRGNQAQFAIRNDGSQIAVRSWSIKK